MQLPRILIIAKLIALVAVTLPFVGSDARAGCGCDHPAPAYAPVMPEFASPGTDVQIHVENASFVGGQMYGVEFKDRKSRTVDVDGIALAPDMLRVAVPGGLRMGPVAITVFEGATQHVFDDSVFTALTAPRRMPTGDAVVLLDNFRGAVSRDGVLYIPVDLSDVRDATQFAFVLANKPLRFTADDVVFYNRDGVDLTLFTLAVTDPTQRQWGSYYGWDVEEEDGIVGTIYDTKSDDSPDPLFKSDLLTYWRHEFHTYAQAHEQGGTHEVDSNGFHPDATLHVDHDHIIIAIRGTKKGSPLNPGRLRADVVAATAVSEQPIEPGVMTTQIYTSSAIDDDDDDDN